jgi:hypothetical protein
MTSSKECTLVSFGWAMKHLLRDKANFDVLEGFLSALRGEEINATPIIAKMKTNPHALPDPGRRMGSLWQDNHTVTAYAARRLLGCLVV